MSYSYSARSLKNLSEAHQDLQTVFNYVIKYRDCSIICGHRGELEQNAAFERKTSKVKFPNSKHNKLPSLAVDVIPWKFKGWKNEEQFHEFGNFVLGVATMLKAYGAIDNEIEWGYRKWGWDFPHWQIKTK